LAAPTHFSKALCAALIASSLGFGSTSVLAQALFPSPQKPASLTEADAAAVERSRQSSREFAAGFDPSSLFNRHQGVANAEVRELLEQMQRSQTTPQMGQLERDREVMQGYTTLVFASQSLGLQGLREIFEAISGREDAVVVLRGIPEGMNITEGVLQVQELAKTFSPMPNVIINPTLFIEHKVTAVPTIVAIGRGKDGSKQVVGRVSGISDPAWLEKKVAAQGQAEAAGCDFGKAGPVEEISEPDLIEVAKQKVMAIDWDEKKREAQARFWKKQNFLELPPAQSSSTRELDPSIVLTDNIAAGDRIIAYKGTRINPLDMRDFTQALVVFDPLDGRQIKALQQEIPKLAKVPGVQRITLIATRFDVQKGWDSYREVTDAFDAPVFLLSPDVASRFELERTPSIVTAKGKRFVIHEIGLSGIEAPETEEK